MSRATDPPSRPSPVRSRLFGVVTASLFAALLSAAVHAQFEPPESWTKAIAPFQIAEGLYYVGTEDLTSFLFTSEDGHILIDAPLDRNVDLILKNIRTLGFQPEDIKIHLASHGHFDHTGGMAALLEVTQGELVLSPQAEILVGAGGKGDFFLGDRAGYPAAKANRTIGHLEQITLGEHTLTAHHTPGHTRGCTTWSGTVRIEGKPQRFVSVCSLSVLPGYRLVGDAPSYPGIAQDFCRSAEHLASLEPELFLASHGQFIDLKAKADTIRRGNGQAFSDPEGYKAWVDSARNKIEKVLTEQGHEGGCEALLGAKR